MTINSSVFESQSRTPSGSSWTSSCVGFSYSSSFAVNSHAGVLRVYGSRVEGPTHQRAQQAEHLEYEHGQRGTGTVPNGGADRPDPGLLYTQAPHFPERVHRKTHRHEVQVQKTSGNHRKLDDNVVKYQCWHSLSESIDFSVLTLTGIVLITLIFVILFIFKKTWKSFLWNSSDVNEPILQLILVNSVLEFLKG